MAKLVSTLSHKKLDKPGCALSQNKLVKAESTLSEPECAKQAKTTKIHIDELKLLNREESRSPKQTLNLT